MKSAKFVGRVGGLAIALGAGFAIATGACGSAQADTGDGTTHSVGSSTRSADSSSRDAASPKKNRTNQPARSSLKVNAAVGIGGLQVSRSSAAKPGSLSSRTVVSPRPTGAAQLAFADETAPKLASTAAASTASRSGSTPTGESLVLAVAALARRELDAAVAAISTQPDLEAFRNRLEYVLDNKAPVVDPKQLDSNADTGVVVGNFNAADPNGDRLVYRITSAPGWGTVQIDAKTGYYVYTPDAEVAKTGGIDGFTVTIDDIGFHLFDSVTTETVFVPVIINAVPPQGATLVDQVNPPVAQQNTVNNPTDLATGILEAAQQLGSALSAIPLLGALFDAGQALRSSVEHALINDAPIPDPRPLVSDPSTGAVYGTFDAYDANGDPLKITVTAPPTNGTVIVDSASGTYVYTPNAVLAATGGVDSFTVSVSDTGLHLFDSTGPVTVTVPVAVTQVVAPPAPPAAAGGVEITSGFDVYNFTSQPLTLISSAPRTTVSSDTPKPQAFQGGGPAVGTVIQPGQSLHFEGLYWFGDFSTYGQVTFTNPQGQTFIANMQVAGIHEPRVSCSTAGGGTCTPAGLGWTAGSQMVFLDAAGTVIDVGTPIQQEAVMNGLCGLSGASCSFKVSKVDLKAYTKETEIYPPFHNQFDSELSTPALELSKEVASQHSLKLSTKATIEVLKALKLEIAAEYGYQFSEKVTVKLSYPSQKVPAHTDLYVYGKVPVIRTTGEMTVKIGNTTYTIKNVVSDVPDIKSGTAGLDAKTITGRFPLSIRASKDPLPA